MRAHRGRAVCFYQNTVRFENVAVEPEWILPFHAAIDLGIGEGAYRDILDFVHSRARPWIDAKVETASEDPLTLSEIGQVRVRLRAADALLRKAGRLVDEAMANPTQDTIAVASIAVAEAKVLSTKAGLLAANIFAVPPSARHRAPKALPDEARLIQARTTGKAIR